MKHCITLLLVPCFTCAPLPKGFESESNGELISDLTDVARIESPSYNLRGENVIENPPVELHEDETNTARCSAAEAEVWRGKKQFSLDLNRMANAGLGLPVLVRPKLIEAFKGLSDDCIECFVENVYCGATRCTLVCAARSLSPECLECVNRECVPALRDCIGAKSDADMPPVPCEADLGSSTPAPVIIRTRKAKNIVAPPLNGNEKTTAEPPVASEPEHHTTQEIPRTEETQVEGRITESKETTAGEETDARSGSFVVAYPQSLFAAASSALALLALVFGGLGGNN